MDTADILNGKKIIVACSAKKMSLLAGSLRELGAEVLPFPVIEIRGTEDTGPLDKALSSLSGYRWIVFTSVHAVLYFFKRIRESGTAVAIPDSLEFCAIGPATASALREHGFEPDLVPERFVAEGVVEALETRAGGRRNLKGCRILLPRAKVARDVLPKALEAAGAHVDIAVCYETIRSELSREDINRFRKTSPDLMVFTSSSTVTNSLEALGIAAGKEMLSKSAVAAIGPVTANTIRSYGKEAEILPGESTIASLVQAIAEYYGRR
jgi:uroporphyrinogen III methyltransferase/synthase